MKTIIHTFENFKTINARLLSLPKLMRIDQWTFDVLKDFKHVILSPGKLYIDHWIHEGLFICMPDFAMVDGHKHGYYLEQTNEMISARDNTYQCGICNEQFNFNPYFCPYCINDPTIDQEIIYKAFCRPISTLDIEITHKSIRVPEWVRNAHTRMPELTTSGLIINI